jgi:hypothetical protein
MPHALALAARLVATFSLLVVPALALFLLSLALRRTLSRDSLRGRACTDGNAPPCRLSQPPR